MATLATAPGALGLTGGAPARNASGHLTPAGFAARGVTSESPALVATGAGSLELLYRDGRPARLRTQRFAGGGWSGPVALDSAPLAARASGVGAAADPGTGAVLAAVVADGRVWTRLRTGQRWSAWSSIGGPASGAPAVAAQGGGRFAVVVRGRFDGLQARFLRHGRWGAWRPLGAKASGSPAAAAQRDGTVVVAVADRRDNVVTSTVTDGKAAARWRPAGLTTTATPGLAVDRGTGAWRLLVRRPDLAAWERVTRTGGRSWDAPVRLGGRLRSGPAVAARTAGRLDVAALGVDGRLVQFSAAAGAWSGPRPIAPLTVGKNTKVVRDGAVTTVSGDPAGRQTVTLAASAAVPRTGDVLVSSSTGATPDGLLAKVTDVRRRPDGSTVVTTSPATLPEAVANGSIDAPITLTADDVASAPAASDGSRNAVPRAASGAVVQKIRRNVTCSRSASATISGSVSVEPSFRFTASWSALGGVQSVSFTGDVTETADLRAAIDGQASCKLAETPLLAHPIRFKPIVFTVGPVPVVLTPQLQLYLDANGSVQAALTTAAAQTAGVTAGLTASAGGVRPTSQLRTSFTYTPPTLSGSARAEVGVSPKFGLLLYGAGGPRFDTRISVRLDADPAKRPAWTLRAALTAGVHLVIPALRVSTGNSTIIRFEKVIAQGNLTAPPPPPTATKTVSASAGHPTCGGDKWSFVLGDVGGTTGITPPASIAARTTTGATVTVPLTRTGGGNTALYETATASRLTGEATAVIDERWNPTGFYFQLELGPCAATATTLTASPATARVGARVTLSGRLTLANGTPLAGRTLTIRWHSPSRTGKGGELGPFTTDAGGRFTATATADEAGRHTFTAEYDESGPLDRAEAASEKPVAVTVT